MMKNTYINIEKLYNMPCHVYLKNKKGIYLASNDHHALSGGAKGSDFIGQTDWEITNPETTTLIQSNDLQVIENNTSLSIVEDVIFNDRFNCEKIFKMFSLKQPLYNGRNKIIGIMGFSFALGEQNTLPDFFHQFQSLNQQPVVKHAGHLKNISDEHHLTSRQADCLHYLLEGKTAKQIAKILNISYRTVEHHISAIKEKYDCTSRSELISLALKMNFIKHKIYTHRT